MFKCKIDLADYDKNDTSVPNVDIAKAKATAKAGVKKLAGAIGEKTDFYITKDYFENNGKPVGHFFAIGTSKKLAKQFIMKEMKGKGTAEGTKNAATGSVYVKNIDGKDKLCFEPHDKCKIPVGQWPKLLKALKSFFAGYKAIVVIGGEVIEEEAGEEGEQETEGDEGEQNESAGSGSVADAAKDAAKAANTAVVDTMKNLIKTIAGSMKGEVMTNIVPNIKNKIVSDKDLNISVDLLAKIEELKKIYETAEQKIKDALKPNVDQILAFAPKVVQIKDAISKLLDSIKQGGETNNSDAANAADAAKAAAEALMKEAQEYLKNFQKNMGDLKEDISNAAEEAIAGGKELLGKLFQ